MMVHNTPFSNLFAVTTCHMKTRSYLVNCKKTPIFACDIWHTQIYSVALFHNMDKLNLSFIGKYSTLANLAILQISN